MPATPRWNMDSDADYIAFLDDDEEADPSWLNELVNTLGAYSADIVTGPVLSRFPTPPAGLDRCSRFLRSHNAAVLTGRC